MCKYATKAITGFISLQRLHQIIVQETNPTNLEEMK